MKKAALLVVSLFAVPAFADDYVRGYVKKDGTYVQPHYRSERNSTNTDNYSTQGNTNPYTGEKGTKTPDYGTANTDYGSKYTDTYKPAKTRR